MEIIFRSAAFLILILLISQSDHAYAENWVEFYKENWTQKSTRAKKKLAYSNCYYYDSDSQVKKSSGDVTLWVKEISANDKITVKKGEVEVEALYRQVHLWCKVKRYEIIQADTSEFELNETMSEEIRKGTYYEKLYQAVCQK